MGLDVYVYHIPNMEDIIEREDIYSDEMEKIKELAGDSKDSEKIRETLKNLSESLNLTEGYSHERKKIVLPSKIYPDHYFKIGYFRSSYNDSGIERVLFNLGLGNMDWIFQNTENGGSYEYLPDWNLALERAENVLEELKKSPGFRIKEVRFESLKNNSSIESPSDAMGIFLKRYNEYQKNPNKGFGSYSSSDGDFYIDEPLKIRAIIPGESVSFFTKGKIKTANIVYEGDNTSYIQSIEIVIETCKWVLSQKDPENYYLHWSS